MAKTIIVDLFIGDMTDDERLEREAKIREALQARYGSDINVYFRYN
jgi:hypothetical protein